MNGLKDIHEEGLAHRDLKPSNIFLSENGIYKLGLTFFFFFFFFISVSVGDYSALRALHSSGNTTVVETPFNVIHFVY
jgi:serine/threonine protein kinase